MENLITEKGSRPVVGRDSQVTITAQANFAILNDDDESESWKNCLMSSQISVKERTKLLILKFFSPVGASAWMLKRVFYKQRKAFLPLEAVELKLESVWLKLSNQHSSKWKSFQSSDNVKAIQLASTLIKENFTDFSAPWKPLRTISSS
jgi:hypothetical protein